MTAARTQLQGFGASFGPADVCGDSCTRAYGELHRELADATGRTGDEHVATKYRPCDPHGPDTQGWV